jgi:hypothetical protein
MIGIVVLECPFLDDRPELGHFLGMLHQLASDLSSEFRLKLLLQLAEEGNRDLTGILLVAHGQELEAIFGKQLELVGTSLKLHKCLCLFYLPEHIKGSLIKVPLACAVIRYYELLPGNEGVYEWHSDN